MNCNEIKVNLENLTDAEREQILWLARKANKLKRKVWHPEYGEHYWFIDSDGIISSTDNDELGIDFRRIRSGNCYKTKEEAEFAKEREKECLYCQKGKVLANGKTTDIGMAIYFVGRYTYLNAYGYNIHGDGGDTISTKINYCPMCGKEVE